MISSFPAFINHLLEQESWAREKLSAHGGKTVHLDTGWFVLQLKIDADGLFETASSDAPANVALHFRMIDLPLMLQDRARIFSYVKLNGDADLANTLSQLYQGLQWDVEADLAKWVGDIPAGMMIAGTKNMVRSVQSTKQKITENLAEFLLEEQPTLTNKFAMEDFSTAVAKIRDDVERLSKRIEKMETKCN